jgi:hypothetical protein
LIKAAVLQLVVAFVGNFAVFWYAKAFCHLINAFPIITDEKKRQTHDDL